MLIFPEVLENDKLEELNRRIQPIEKYFTERGECRYVKEICKRFK